MDDDDTRVYVAHTALDLLGVVEATAELPEGTPIRIQFRGATLDYPDGLSENQAYRLANFSHTLDTSGQGVH